VTIVADRALRSIRVIGPGRAGGALMLALGAAGWEVREPIGRGDEVGPAAHGVDLLVIATPDGAVADVADRVEPDPATVVVHLAGSLGLGVLSGHPARGAIHPLVALPSAELGAVRLRGAWFAVAGDPIVGEVVAALDGRSFSVADTDRALYHAAACVASNHLVALMGSVERMAAELGIPMEAYLDLVRATIENVAELGPTGALTGPAARGDWETIERHRAALSAEAPGELEAYDALVSSARRLLDKESLAPEVDDG
jgi:predicted short-subunit dehydrogenase-like oxidoreductase (DUF2520 family)